MGAGAWQEPKTLPPIEATAVVAAPIDKVWAAFTTTDGLKAWMVKQAEVDTRNGGMWKTKYGAEGTLGDEGTIMNEILAVDPGRMFAMRIHKTPKGFPFPNVYREMWTVVYFDPVEGGKTKVTARGHGFKDTPEAKQMRAFFEMGNKQTLDMLVKHFAK
ncbi:MAG: SRPBCC family protein [Fimbriimonas sp.]